MDVECLTEKITEITNRKLESNLQFLTRRKIPEKELMTCDP